MLHHVDFFGAQVGDQASTEDVRSSDTSFWVEILEPKRS